MTRRNTTHLSRLARLVASTAPMPYAKALTLCRTASAAGALRGPLDDTALGLAVAQVLRFSETGSASSVNVAALEFAHRPDGEPFRLTQRELATHVLFFGAPGSGKTIGARTLAQVLFQQGHDGVFLELDAEIDPSAPGLRAGRPSLNADALRQAADRRGAAFHSVTLPAPGEIADLGTVDVRRAGMTHVARVAAPGGAALEAHVGAADGVMRELVALATERALARPQDRLTPMFVVVDNVARVDPALLCALLGRARSAQIVMVMTSIRRWMDSAVWNTLTQNVGTLVATWEDSSAWRNLARLATPGLSADDLAILATRQLGRAVVATPEREAQEISMTLDGTPPQR